MILLLTSICGLGSIVISMISTSPLYKFVFLSIGIFIFITIGIKYLYFLTMETVKNSKQPTNKKSNSSQTVKYQPREINNPDYKELTETLKFSMKNKLLNREQILDFKKQLNGHLGSQVKRYSKFDNDLHEIYSKLKNKSLKSNDYIELLNVLNNYKIN